MNLLTLARAFATDEAGRLNDSSYSLAISLALARYAADRPYIASGDVCVQADGTTVPLPDGWIRDFSRVLEVEPASGQALPKDAYKQNARHELQLSASRQPGEKMKVFYTCYHTEDSLPLVDFEAVAHYAAAILLDNLAVIYSGDRQSTIDADSVDHMAKGGSYAARANEQRKLYLDHMGIDPKRTVAAGALVSVGHGRMLHGAPKPRRRAF